MIIERIRRSGYRLEIASDKILINSSRRPRELILTVFVTAWIGIMTTLAKESNVFLFKILQYIIIAILLVAPFLILFLNWTRTILIKKGQVEIFGPIKGKVKYKEILSVNLAVEQSAINKIVTIKLKDRKEGTTPLLVIYLKQKEIPEARKFLDQIIELIGIQDTESKTS